MGYSTDFTGTLKPNKPFTESIANYINQLAETRRMQGDVNVIKKIDPDWKEHCFNGELGEEGEYYVGGGGFAGQDDDESVVEYNYPPSSQPSLWNHWIINEYGEVVFDECEKFYKYAEGLEYLIKHFFEPEGYILNGCIKWQGEDIDDTGVIYVENNVVVTEKSSKDNSGQILKNII